MKNTDDFISDYITLNWLEGNQKPMMRIEWINQLT